MRLIALAFSLWMAAAAAAQPGPGPSGEQTNSPPDLLAAWQDYLNDHPENTGLREFLRAIQMWNSSLSYYFVAMWEIEDILEVGWIGYRSNAECLIQCNAPALRVAGVAAESEVFEFPPPYPGWIDLDLSTEQFMDLISLIKCMLADAHRLLAQDHGEQAIDRCLRVFRLCQRMFMADSLQRLRTIGYWWSQQSLEILTALIRNVHISDSTIAELAQSLESIDQDRDPGTARLQTLSDRERAVFGAIRQNPEIRETIRNYPWPPEVTPEMLATFNHAIDDPEWFESLMTQHLPEFAALLNGIATMPEPLVRLRPSDPNSSASIAWDMLVVHEFENLARGDANVTTRLRLCRALCAMRLHDREGFREIIDPHSGNPFLGDADHIRSIGPDCVDQGGEVIYDPTNGLVSAGDVVVRF